jgi:hypothetical protein
MIVVQLSFSGADAINTQQGAYSRALPFGLLFGDRAESVTKMLGASPSRRDPSMTLPDHSAERFVFKYVVDHLQVIAKFDGAHRLIAVYKSGRATQCLHRHNQAQPA